MNFPLIRNSGNSTFGSASGMAARTAAFDWHASPLGSPDTWPAALKASVRLVLDCKLPMCLAWGKDFTQFYNDAFVPILGAKDSNALGSDARVTWSETWPLIAPMWEQVLRGEGIGAERLKLTIERYGYPEDCYFSFSYSPVPDDVGNPAGVLVTFAETTREVLAEMRQAFQLDLADALRNTADPMDVIGQGTAKLGAFLELGEVAYVEGDPTADEAIVKYRWTDGRGPERPARANPFGGFAPADRADLLAGRCLRVDRGGADGRSLLVFPCLRQGAGPGFLFLYCEKPHRWTAADLEIAGDATRRICEALERADMAASLRKAEQRIRANHDYLRLLIDSGEEGFYSVDRDGVTIMCNTAFLKMLGFAREEDAIGRKLHDVIHGAHADGSHYDVCDCPIYQAARFGTPADVYDELFFRLDGTGFPVEYRARPVWLDGQLHGAVCTFVDVTSRRQTEQALQQSEAHLKSLFAQSGAGISETDLTGRLLRMNDRFCEIVGRPREELVKMRMHDFTHPDDIERNIPLFERVTSSGIPFEIEKRYVRPDGQVVWVNNTVSPVHNGEGGPVESIIAVSVDISERKRVEEALQEADRRKDEFLAMLAHELRNPMAPIRAAADLMAVAQLPPDRLKRTSQIISRQVKHMTGLVDDLLDVSRVTRGLVELARQDLDVKNVITDALEQVRPLIEEKRHHLTVDLDPDPAHVLGDHKRLVQILTNLLNNAAKYTPAGGLIHLSMQASDGQVRLVVEDNGVGIPPELQPRIFDLFAQAERSPDRAQGGLGIGLALVKSLAELHGGSVVCDSAGAGKGSRFIVNLPRVLRQAGGRDTDGHRLPGAAASARRRILIVDDNVDAAQILAMYLEAAGHELAVEHSSQEALRRLESDVPEVAILDIGLPDIDGNELARRLRAQPATAGITLIALTGYGQEKDRQRALQAGFDRFLVKPVDAATVLELVSM